MRNLIRFLWNASRGHRLTPWRSPYLRWRIESYCGVRMDKVGFLEFFGFIFREREQLAGFLKWMVRMEAYARAKPKNM